MYSYIKGTYEGQRENYIVLEASGIGYKIFATSSTAAKMPQIGMQAKVYTYFNVREDAMELYGFYSEEERDLYEILISVSGVGPKMGISLLSYVSPAEFAAALAAEDTKTLTKAPGVGPKLAKRIILELKDKFKTDSPDIPTETIVSEPSERQEAAQALISLGYSASEAQRAVDGLNGSIEDIVGKALKNLMGKS